MFNEHLRTLGFDRPVALGWDKDGGLDILWLLPIGSIPHRPIVSVQCKNGEQTRRSAPAVGLFLSTAVYNRVSMFPASYLTIIFAQHGFPPSR